MKQLVLFLYFLMLFPAFSLVQSLLGIYVQNRILWLPCGLILLCYAPYNKLRSFHKPIIFLSLFFLLYCFLAIVHHWNFLLYCGYFLTFLLLLTSLNVVYCQKRLFLSFFKWFLILNAIYIVYQIICCNLGLQGLAMIQSNLPAQKNAGYMIPTFLTSFLFRYTGLFNESSPLAFYLCISFCFFTCLGRPFLKYRNLSLLLLVFSGSKFAYLFLLCYLTFFLKNKFVKIIALSALAVVVYLVLTDLSFLIEMTNGEMASVGARMKGVEGIGDTALTNWGSGLATSSDGEVELNMFSILLGGFGRYGMVIILLMILLFYRTIQFEQKSLFILPFVIGILSNGSLLIVQYGLLAYCLIFFHHLNPTNLYASHNFHHHAMLQ